MGREIRLVPANWQHPKDDDGNYIPMYDQDYQSALDAWIVDYQAWQRGEYVDDDTTQAHLIEIGYRNAWDYLGAPPRPERYHERFDNPTWLQVYETVSEGTPVTPAFATADELIFYLVNYGDYWDQISGCGGWSLRYAEEFVKAGWMPSLIVVTVN